MNYVDPVPPRRSRRLIGKLTLVPVTAPLTGSLHAGFNAHHPGPSWLLTRKDRRAFAEPIFSRLPERSTLRDLALALRDAEPRLSSAAAVRVAAETANSFSLPPMPTRWFLPGANPFAEVRVEPMPAAFACHRRARSMLGVDNMPLSDGPR